MMTFIGTFGVSSNLGKYYQPIKAGTAEQASRIMLEKHGSEWSTIYTVDEYIQLQKKGHFSGHKPLKWIGGGFGSMNRSRSRSISVYEMLKTRFDEITTNPRSSLKQKDESLEVLRSDILKIDWEESMPPEVERLLWKIEVLI